MITDVEREGQFFEPALEESHVPVLLPHATGGLEGCVDGVATEVFVGFEGDGEGFVTVFGEDAGEEDCVVEGVGGGFVARGHLVYFVSFVTNTRDRKSVV